MTIAAKLERMIRGLVSRAVVNSRASTKLFQVLWLDDRVSAGVELFEPQGLHFNPPPEADGLLLAPSGNKSASVLINAQAAVPSDAVAPGEGGLHYLGTYKVFCKADGTLALGAYAPTMSAAVAEYVDARITALQVAFDAHTHVYSPGPSPAAPTAPPVPVGPQATVASTKVKLEP